jgi:hypothetical protein
MHDVRYYQEQAERARRWSKHVFEGELAEMLTRMAQDFDDIASDLLNGAVNIRHPELLPQQTRKR